VFRESNGQSPSEGDKVEAGTPANPETENYSMHAFGSYFVEARVNEDTGEVRVPRMTGSSRSGESSTPRSPVRSSSAG
jgi:xanthine dehydrogenase YagR molybdenum-binding subunit